MPVTVMRAVCLAAKLGMEAGALRPLKKSVHSIDHVPASVRLGLALSV